MKIQNFFIKKIQNHSGSLKVPRYVNSRTVTFTSDMHVSKAVEWLLKNKQLAGQLSITN